MKTRRQRYRRRELMSTGRKIIRFNTYDKIFLVVSIAIILTIIIIS